MGEKIRTFIDSATDKQEDFTIDHPVIAGSIYSAAILTVSVPICLAAYKYASKIQGKEIVNQLIEAGVKLS